MEIVKYVSYKENSGAVEFFFRLHDRLADFIRKVTKYDHESLEAVLGEDNIFRYSIAREEDFEELHPVFVETIERISNSDSDVFFYNHVLTNNGSYRFPGEVHELLRKEYGLADINKVEEDAQETLEEHLEWWVAHFFIKLARVVFEKPFVLDEQEEKIADVKDSAMSLRDVSEILNNIKKIEHIVVVDDARKLGPKAMKQIRERFEQKDNASE